MFAGVCLTGVCMCWCVRRRPRRGRSQRCRLRRVPARSERTARVWRRPATWRSSSSSPRASSRGASSWASLRWPSPSSTRECRVPACDANVSAACVSGGRGAGDGEALRERLQPDHHLQIRGLEPELQEHVQTQTPVGEMAQRRRLVLKIFRNISLLLSL